MLSVFCSAQCNRTGDEEDGLKLLMLLEIQLNSNIRAVSGAQEGKLQSHSPMVLLLVVQGPVSSFDPRRVSNS